MVFVNVEGKLFWLVEFPNAKRIKNMTVVEIIPWSFFVSEKNRISGTYKILFPKPPFNQEDSEILHDLVRECKAPLPDWLQFDIKEIRQFGTGKD